MVGFAVERNEEGESLRLEGNSTLGLVVRPFEVLTLRLHLS